MINLTIPIDQLQVEVYTTKRGRNMAIVIGDMTLYLDAKQSLELLDGITAHIQELSWDEYSEDEDNEVVRRLKALDKESLLCAALTTLRGQGICAAGSGKYNEQAET